MIVNRQNADNWSLLVFYTQFIVLGLFLLSTNLMIEFLANQQEMNELCLISEKMRNDNFRYTFVDEWSLFRSSPLAYTTSL